MSERNEQTQNNELDDQSLRGFTCTPSSCVDVGILLELGSIGAGHAATSLSDVLQQQVLIDVPKIHTFPVHELPNFYHKHDTPTTGVYMRLIEESECDILLLLEAKEAEKIAMIMTMCSSPAELDDAMKQSAIQELANILTGSFLSAISDFTAIKLIPAPPQWIEDSFDAIIDNFLIKQALISNQALVFDTNFHTADGNANAVLMIFPSPELQELLTQKSKEMFGIDSKPDEPKIIYPENAAFSVIENQKPLG